MIVGGLSDVAFLGNRIFMRLEDAFDRADQQGLGNIPIAERPWQTVSGSWSIASNGAVAANTNDPIAVVDAYTPDVDMTLDISSTGYDGIVFRLTDENNYYRLVNYYNRSTRTTYTTQVSYRSTNLTWNSDRDYTGHNYTTTWATPGTVTTGWTSTTSTATGSVRSYIKETSERRRVPSGSYTVTTRQVQLQKVEAGSVTTLHVENVPVTTSLRVVADGDTIQTYANATLLDTRSDTFNQTATKHGITRGSSVGGQADSALNNFSLTPLILL